MYGGMGRPPEVHSRALGHVNVPLLDVSRDPGACADGGVNYIVHSLGKMLKSDCLSVYMVFTSPLDPYSIAKSLVFVVTATPKFGHPPRLTELKIGGL